MADKNRQALPKPNTAAIVRNRSTSTNIPPHAARAETLSTRFRNILAHISVRSVGGQSLETDVSPTPSTNSDQAGFPPPFANTRLSMQSALSDRGRDYRNTTRLPAFPPVSSVSKGLQTGHTSLDSELDVDALERSYQNTDASRAHADIGLPPAQKRPSENALKEDADRQFLQVDDDDSDVNNLTQDLKGLNKKDAAKNGHVKTGTKIKPLCVLILFVVLAAVVLGVLIGANVVSFSSSNSELSGPKGNNTGTPTLSPLRPGETRAPTNFPTNNPTKKPTKSPTNAPTKHPSRSPTKKPTKFPTKAPTMPTNSPTNSPLTEEQLVEKATHICAAHVAQVNTSFCVDRTRFMRCDANGNVALLSLTNDSSVLAFVKNCVDVANVPCVCTPFDRVVDENPCSNEPTGPINPCTPDISSSSTLWNSIFHYHLHQINEDDN